MSDTHTHIYMFLISGLACAMCTLCADKLLHNYRAYSVRDCAFQNDCK